MITTSRCSGSALGLPSKRVISLRNALRELWKYSAKIWPSVRVPPIRLARCCAIDTRPPPLYRRSSTSSVAPTSRSALNASSSAAREGVTKLRKNR